MSLNSRGNNKKELNQLQKTHLWIKLMRLKNYLLKIFSEKERDKVEELQKVLQGITRASFSLMIWVGYNKLTIKWEEQEESKTIHNRQ